MRKSRFTEEQIVAALKLAEGSSVDEVCRKMEISRATFFAWKKKYGGMGVSDARRLKQLEDEHRRLKKLGSGPRSPDGARGARKKILRPAVRRNAVGHLRSKYGCSERRACKALGYWRGTIRYRTQRVVAPELVKDLRQVAMERPRFGYRGCT